jgi:amino acid adenylation domain-containing protein
MSPTPASQSIRAIGEFHPFTFSDCAQSIPERFARQVARHPERIAVSAGGRATSYRRLAEMADRVASAVSRQGATAARPIGLLLEHDEWAAAAVLGVLQAGAIVVGLDPHAPAARTTAVLDDAGIETIVADGPHLDAARRLAGPDRRIVDVTALPDRTDPVPTPAIASDALAYLLYTSGSTGAPKGVMHSHATVLRSAMGYTNGFRLSAEDRVAVLASLGVAQGVAASFCALLNGATACLLNPRSAGVDGVPEWLARESITVWISAATIFRQLAENLSGAQEFPRLRLIKLGAEPVRDTDVALYRRHFSGHAVLVNALGTTEALSVTQHVMDARTPLAGATAAIGEPEEGLAVLLLDETGAEVDAGAVGEIAIKSRYLSPGYWRRPEQTRAVFVPTEDGEHYYRTGDLGRRLADGALEHLGRKDFRVKLHGARVELEEVEAVLARHPAVCAAAVEVREEDGEPRLIAYIVPEATPPTLGGLRGHVAAILPGPSVPSSFVFLDALPLMGNGKVDRRALPDCVGRRPPLDTEFVPPQTPFEEAVAEIWARVLRLGRVGARDSFLDLGGTSLSALRVLTEVRERFAPDLTMTALFEHPTVEALARALVLGQAERLGADGVSNAGDLG